MTLAKYTLHKSEEIRNQKKGGGREYNQTGRRTG